MIVSAKGSVSIDPARRFDVFALAGKLEVYRHGMKLRDAVKAIISAQGTGILDDLNTVYPAGLFDGKPSHRRQKRKAVKENG